MPRLKNAQDADFVRREVIVIEDGESVATSRPRRRASIPAAAKVAALVRSEEKVEDDDCLIVSESTEPARRSAHHRTPTRGRPAHGGSARHLARLHSLDVELNMECVEEALSPWQIMAAQRAKEEYESALEKIRQAKAQIAAEQQRIKERLEQKKLQEEQLRRLQLQELQRQQEQLQQQRALQMSQFSTPFADSDNSELHQKHSVPDGGSSQQQYSTGEQTMSAPKMIGRPTVRNRQVSASDPAPTANRISLKRSQAADLSSPPLPKKRTSTPPHKQPEIEGGSWVPLDEYYYGKKEGDPAYREEKGGFRFKCWYCHKMLYNNVRMMFHMQGHIDQEKQQNLDLSDLTQCKHCYKQFDTPFDMQCHIERVHQNTGNVLVCRICEKDHEHQVSLRQHMRNCHTSCEMPYICQLCNFRSSIYSDVVDHFKKRHDSSQYILCMYCLRVFRMNFSKTSGWGLTQNYCQHLQKHQIQSKKKKCACCKLTFLNSYEVKVHKSKDHLPNQKGTGLKSFIGEQKQEVVMIQVPEAGARSKTNKLKSLNAPSVSKVRDLRGLRMYSSSTDLNSQTCFDCKEPMASLDHYRKYVECFMCRYATTCGNAYAKHMMGFHTGSISTLTTIVPKERPMAQTMYCLCGYSSLYGNSVANHLVFCSKRTAYLVKPEAKWFEYDDEQEDFNPFEPYIEEPDVPEVESPKKDQTILGALGLVKKKSDLGAPEEEFPSEESPEVVVGHIIQQLLNAVFPAESAAEQALEEVMARVEDHVTSKESKQIQEQQADSASSSSNHKQGITSKGLQTGRRSTGRPHKVSIMMGGYRPPLQEDKEEPERCMLQEDSLLSTSDSTSTSHDGEMPTSASLSRESSREDSFSKDVFLDSTSSHDGSGSRESLLPNEPDICSEVVTGLASMPSHKDEPMEVDSGAQIEDGGQSKTEKEINAAVVEVIAVTANRPEPESDNVQKQNRQEETMDTDTTTIEADSKGDQPEGNEESNVSNCCRSPEDHQGQGVAGEASGEESSGVEKTETPTDTTDNSGEVVSGIKEDAAPSDKYVHLDISDSNVKNVVGDQELPKSKPLETEAMKQARTETKDVERKIESTEAIHIENTQATDVESTKATCKESTQVSDLESNSKKDSVSDDMDSAGYSSKTEKSECETFGNTSLAPSSKQNHTEKEVTASQTTDERETCIVKPDSNEHCEVFSPREDPADAAVSICAKGKPSPDTEDSKEDLDPNKDQGSPSDITVKEDDACVSEEVPHVSDAVDTSKVEGKTDSGYAVTQERTCLTKTETSGFTKGGDATNGVKSVTKCSTSSNQFAIPGQDIKAEMVNTKPRIEDSEATTADSVKQADRTPPVSGHPQAKVTEPFQQLKDVDKSLPPAKTDVPESTSREDYVGNSPVNLTVSRTLKKDAGTLSDSPSQSEHPQAHSGNMAEDPARERGDRVAARGRPAAVVPAGSHHNSSHQSGLSDDRPRDSHRFQDRDKQHYSRDSRSDDRHRDRRDDRRYRDDRGYRDDHFGGRNRFHPGGDYHHQRSDHRDYYQHDRSRGRGSYERRSWHDHRGNRGGFRGGYGQRRGFNRGGYSGYY